MSDRVAQIVSEFEKPRNDFVLDLGIKVGGGKNKFFYLKNYKSFKKLYFFL